MCNFIAKKAILGRFLAKRDDLCRFIGISGRFLAKRCEQSFARKISSKKVDLPPAKFSSSHNWRDFIFLIGRNSIDFWDIYRLSAIVKKSTQKYGRGTRAARVGL